MERGKRNLREQLRELILSGRFAFANGLVVTDEFNEFLERLLSFFESEIQLGFLSGFVDGVFKFESEAKSVGFSLGYELDPEGLASGAERSRWPEYWKTLGLGREIVEALDG